MDTHQKRIWLALAFILVLRLSLQFLLYRDGFVSLTADDFGRAVAAGRWAQHPEIVWNNAWLPFHMIMVGSILKLVWELLWVPRTINIFFGAVSILLMYGIGAVLFHDRRVGLVAALLLALNTGHLWLSSGMLVEIPYLALILSCVLSFLFYLNRDQIIYLFLSSLSLGLANGFRYEGWMVSLVFSLYLAWLGISRLIQHQDKLDRAALLWFAAVLPWVFPMIWVVFGYQQTGEFLQFFSAIKLYKLTWYGSQSNYFNYLDVSWTIDRIAVVLLLPALVYCTVKFWKSPAVRWFLGISILPLIMFIYLHGGQVEPPGNYIRYLTPFLCMFIPFLGALVVSILDWLWHPAWRRALLFALFALALIAQVITSFRFTNDPATTGLAVGQQLRELRRSPTLKTTPPALIELSYWEYLAIHVGANDLSRIVYDRNLDFTDRSAPSLILLNPQILGVCVTQYGIKYVLAKDAQLTKVLEQTYSLIPESQINGYGVYPIPPDFSSSIQVSNVTCPLPFGTGY